MHLSVALSQYWHKKCLNKKPTCIAAFLSVNPHFLSLFPRSLFIPEWTLCSLVILISSGILGPNNLYCNMKIYYFLIYFFLMAGWPAVRPNSVVSITRKFIMSSTIIKNIHFWQIGNISYTHNKGKFVKIMILKTVDFLVICQKETLQWDNIADMSTSKEEK